MSAALAQYVALGRRSILNTVRQPTAIVPSFLFPLIFLSISSAAFERSTALPGFPQVDSFLQFVIAATIVQSALFGSISAGAAMATDIEGGFFERLIASPVSRMSILIGRLAGSATIGFFQALLYFGLTILFGLTVEGGTLGILAIATVSGVISAGIGSIAVALAIKTGSAEAVQGSFPMLFAFLLLSSAFFPRTLMDGWFKTAATLNPLSHLIESLRSIVIEGFSISEYLTALGIAGAILVIGVILSSTLLRRRLGGRV